MSKLTLSYESLIAVCGELKIGGDPLQATITDVPPEIINLKELKADLETATGHFLQVTGSFSDCKIQRLGE